MTHIPLNAHPKATGPDTNPLETMVSDDEFLESLPEAQENSPPLNNPLLDPEIPLDGAEVILNVAVLNERCRQLELWGVQTHAPGKWTDILGEEVGEVCKAINEDDPHGYRKELIQVAAVAVAAVEAFDRLDETDPTTWQRYPRD